MLPTYMGLIKQIDDHLGQLFSWFEETGKDKETMIVFTSDHGGYLGDHWMGKKDMFHECPVRVQLIIYDRARKLLRNKERPAKSWLKRSTCRPRSSKDRQNTGWRGNPCNPFFTIRTTMSSETRRFRNSTIPIARFV